MLAFRRAMSVLVLVCGLLFSLSAGTAQAQVIDSYTAALTAASPAFQRPIAGTPPTVGSGGAVYKYHQRTITIATTGNYSFASNADFDNYTFLYSGSFDPNNPLTNAITGNDDYVSGNLRRSGFSITNLAAGTYILVTTTFSSAFVPSATSGNFLNRVFVTGTPTPRFARPNAGAPPTTVSTAATSNNVYYEVVDIASQVTQNGFYAIRVVSNNPIALDNFSILYNGAFTPATPLVNAIVANDTFGTATDSGYKVNLTAGQPYKVVVTGSTNFDFDPGNYVVSVTKITDPPATTFQRTGVGYPPAATVTGSYPYYLETWTPATAGFYKIKTVATDPNLFNTFTALYDTTFDPANPLTNIIVANDTFTNEGGASGFYFSAAAGHTYKIVVTGTTVTDFGEFTTQKDLVAPLKKTVVDSTVGAPAITDRPIENATSPLLPPTTQSTFDPPHKAYQMSVSASGNYTLHMIRDNTVNTTYDTYLLVYNGALTPASSLTNVFAGSDDFDTMTSFNRSALVNLPLTAGVQYTVVATGYATDDEGGFKLEAFGPGNVQIGTTVKITGTLTTVVPNKTLPISFRLRPVGGTPADDITKNVTVTTAADGTAPFELRDIPSRAYNIAAKGELTLQSVVTNVDASGGDVSGVAITLLSGDSQADGFVDIQDLLTLIAHYNQVFVLGEENDYLASVDFNYDNANNITDLLIIISNYNKQSQLLP